MTFRLLCTETRLTNQMIMNTNSNAIEASGSLELDSGGEGGFSDLAKGDYACVQVWGTVETSENGQLVLTVDQAALMTPDEEGGDSEESEGEDESESQPAAAAVMRKTVKY